MDAPQQEEITFDVAGSPRTAILRSPSRLCSDPMLLINFAGAWRDAIDAPPYRIVSDVFLAAGHRVAAFDMPAHGDRIDHYGPGLTGIAAAIKDGKDPFGDLRDTGRTLIELCLARGLMREGCVFLNGTSRGGLAALHIMAGCPHVLACAIHAPVIYLPVLTEMRDLAGNEIAERSNAFALLDALADRPVFTAIGETDPRIGEQHTFAFHAQLTARSRHRPPELYVAPGISHGPTYSNDAGYNAAAGFLLHWAGEAMKRPLEVTAQSP